MVPNGGLEDDKQLSAPMNQDNLPEKKGNIVSSRRQPLKWLNIIAIGVVHMIALYAVFHTPSRGKFLTFLFALLYSNIGGFGVTGGAHRLWSHRSYKARMPLKILLAIFYSIAGQNTIPDWVRDHRVHHKFTETDADPHNANRGFFFSHVGWLMQKKHPDVLEKGKRVDMSDILSDPLVVYHTRFFSELKLIFCYVIPISVPIYFWGESFYISFLVNNLRYVLSLNGTWLVNSAAHFFGSRPYNSQIKPAENAFVSLIACGEGWHNYHHVFPWDYKAAELGQPFNLTTGLLNIFASIGWAYDLKYPSKDMVDKVAKRFGDGGHHSHHQHAEEVDDRGFPVGESENEKNDSNL